MDQSIKNNLFSLIRHGLGISDSTVECSAKDYDVLFSIGVRQSILPILFRGMDRISVPPEMLRKFDTARLKNVYQTLQIQEALGIISNVLEDAGIMFIPLKGAVLRKYYPNPYLRTSCDLDVLVHEEDVDRAVAAIEKTTDFRAVGRNYHDISMISTTVHLELHFSLRENMESIDGLLDRVWDYATPVLEDGLRYKMTPEYLIFHTIAHMSYHMVRGGLGIRPFLDLWLLRKNTAYDEDLVRQMCADCGILIFYEKSCRLADAWMTGQPIPEDLGTLEDYAMNGGVFGNRETIAAANQRKYKGFHYYLHRLFVSKAVMEMEYPKLKERPYLLPACWVSRWLRLLDPQKRKHVKAEINSVRKSSADAIDSFDELLAGLGL